MLEYTVNDIERMQRNAERRMKNMQERSRSHVSGGQQKSAPPPTPPSPPPQVRRTNIFDLLNFKNLEMDADRSLIIMLMLMLNSGGGDQLLMLALIYIML